MSSKLDRFTVVAGSAEGPTRLNAFDNALLAAGCGNQNLLRVSSILPPGATESPRLEVPPGSLVPTAFASIESDTPGDRVAAAIGVGIGDPADYGVIMEFSGRATREEAEDRIRSMLEEAFARRGRRLERVVLRSAVHTVEGTGCAFAAVLLWGGES